MQAALERMRPLGKRSPADRGAAEVRLHQLVLIASANRPLIAATTAGVSAFMHLARQLARGPTSVEEHEAILAGIRLRDPAAAREAMKRHLSRRDPKELLRR